MSDDSRPSFIERALRAIPVIGYAARCVEEERVKELLILVGVVLLAAVLAVVTWGYPALITIALTLVALAGAIVIGTTMG